VVDGRCLKDQGGILALEHRVRNHSALDDQGVGGISVMYDVMRREKTSVTLVLKAGYQ